MSIKSVKILLDFYFFEYHNDENHYMRNPKKIITINEQEGNPSHVISLPDLPQQLLSQVVPCDNSWGNKKLNE